MSREFVFRHVVTAVILGSAVSLPASRAGAEEPMELRRIMQDLGEDMQSVTDGISREDWRLVAEAAARIAEHPQPPVTEKVRILTFLGSEAARFRGFDEQTHRAGKALKEAAEGEDARAVIDAFATLQTACLGCHQAFRGPFVEHFYAER